jgi:hypothetical protein
VSDLSKSAVYEVHNSVEQNYYWKADSHSVSQKIPRLLWKPKVHYRIYKCLTLNTALSQMHPVHTLPSYFFKRNSNIILPSTLRFSKLPLSFRFSNQSTWCYIYFSSLSLVFLWNPKVHYRIYKRLPLNTTLSQIIQTTTPCHHISLRSNLIL